MMKVVKHCTRLPRDVVDTYPRKHFRISLQEDFINIILIY